MFNTVTVNKEVLMHFRSSFFNAVVTMIRDV